MRVRVCVFSHSVGEGQEKMTDGRVCVCVCVMSTQQREFCEVDLQRKQKSRYGKIFPTVVWFAAQLKQNILCKNDAECTMRAWGTVVLLVKQFFLNATKNKNKCVH